MRVKVSKQCFLNRRPARNTGSEPQQTKPQQTKPQRREISRDRQFEMC